MGAFRELHDVCVSPYRRTRDFGTVYNNNNLN